MEYVTITLQVELLGRLLISVLLGAVLGWERQLGQHPAGFRTHILVTLGSTAYTIAGTYGVAGFGTVQDAGRVAAQIVTGIGFLGAGTIWRSGSDRIIYGLTTAASIWVAAAIGMLAGFGLYVLALGCALLGFTVLRVLKSIEDAPVRMSVPRWRRWPRRAAPPPAAERPGGAPAAGDPTSGGEGPEDGMLVPRARDAAALPAVKGPRRKARGKKSGKRKRRDAELEAAAQISDAPIQQRE